MTHRVYVNGKLRATRESSRGATSAAAKLQRNAPNSTVAIAKPVTPPAKRHAKTRPNKNPIPVYVVSHGRVVKVRSV
jgi:hypothetical protein